MSLSGKGLGLISTIQTWDADNSAAIETEISYHLFWASQQKG